MFELGKCPVCHASSLRTVFESTFSGTAKEAPQYFLANRRGVVHGRIQECAECNFKFTNPQFTLQEYDEIYKKAPGPEGTNVVMDEGDRRRFNRLARHVRRDVTEVGRFLDFGCGRGGFLIAMDDATGIGFEVGDPTTFNLGKNYIIKGRFLDLIGSEPFKFGSFDTITAFDVFEHLPILEKYVYALKSLLKPGGRLVVTVPDVGSWNARLSGQRWNMLLLEHLWYFDADTLRRFMKRAGFHETRHRSLPYDAPLAHIARRVAQTYGITLPRIDFASSLVLPVPIGLMYGVYQRED